MKKLTKDEEIISLNNQLLFKDFSIEELEQRLETDPLFFTSILDIGNNSALPCDIKCTCYDVTSFVCECYVAGKVERPMF